MRTFSQGYEAFCARYNSSMPISEGFYQELIEYARNDLTWMRDNSQVMDTNSTANVGNTRALYIIGNIEGNGLGPDRTSELRAAWDAIYTAIRTMRSNNVGDTDIDRDAAELALRQLPRSNQRSSGTAGGGSAAYPRTQRSLRNARETPDLSVRPAERSADYQSFVREYVGTLLAYYEAMQQAENADPNEEQQRPLRGEDDNPSADELSGVEKAATPESEAAKIWDYDSLIKYATEDLLFIAKGQREYGYKATTQTPALSMVGIMINGHQEVRERLPELHIIPGTSLLVEDDRDDRDDREDREDDRLSFGANDDSDDRRSSRRSQEDDEEAQPRINPVEFSNPGWRQPTQAQGGKMQTLATAASSLSSAHDKTVAAKGLLLDIWGQDEDYTYTVNSASTAIQQAHEVLPTNQRVHYSITNPQLLINAAIRDLQWLAADPNNRANFAPHELCPTKALSLVSVLVKGLNEEPEPNPPTHRPLVSKGVGGGVIIPDAWRGGGAWTAEQYDKLDVIAEAMGNLHAAASANNGRQSQQWAQEALGELFPRASKVQKKARVDLRTTSFLGEMRAVAAEQVRSTITARREDEQNAAEGRALVDALPNDRGSVRIPESERVSGPWISKYEIMEANVAAGVDIMAKRVADAMPDLVQQQVGATSATNIGSGNVFVRGLWGGIALELEKNPEVLYKKLGGADNAILAQHLSNKLHDVFQFDTSETAPLFGIVSDIGPFYYNSCLGNIIKAREETLDALNSEPADRDEKWNGYSTGRIVGVADKLFAIEQEMRKGVVAECKRLVEKQHSELRPVRADSARYPNYLAQLEKIAAFEQEIKEHEAIIKAREALTHDKHGMTQLIAGVIGSLGALGGTLVGTGMTAGITAAASETAREALHELIINGSATKFLEGIATGNPILIMVAIGSVLGLVGLVSGAFLAAEGAGELRGGKEVRELFAEYLTKEITDIIAESAQGGGRTRGSDGIQREQEQRRGSLEVPQQRRISQEGLLEPDDDSM